MLEDSEKIDLEVDIGGEKKTFHLLGDLVAYSKAQIAHYSSFERDGLENGKAPEKYLMGRLNAIGKIENLISHYRNGNQPLSSLKQSLEAYFNETLPGYTSFQAQILHHVRNEYGAEAASGVVVVIFGINYPHTFSRPNVLLGITAYFNAISGVNKTSSSSAKRAMKRLTERIDGDFQKRSEQIDDLVANFEDMAGDLDAANRDLISQWSSEVIGFVTKSQEKLAKKIEEFEATEQAYKDVMRLDRPREYWSNKATKHEDSSGIYAMLALGWFVLGGFGTLFGLWSLFGYAVNGLSEGGAFSSVPLPLLTLLGAIAFVLTTVFFWIARILVRLWLSEIHLGMDARERVTMIESYLALSASGSISESQLDLVLGPIFRPTEDGIVKDDAAADPNLMVNLLGRGRSS